MAKEAEKNADEVKKEGEIDREEDKEEVEKGEEIGKEEGKEEDKEEVEKGEETGKEEDKEEVEKREETGKEEVKEETEKREETGKEEVKEEIEKGEETGKEEDKEVIEELEDVEGYDAEELRKEIEGTEFSEEEKSPEKLLSDIREERAHLEEDRARFLKEMEQKEQMMKKRAEKKEEKKEKEPLVKPKLIKSFARERRKRKELESIRTYLFIGEFALLLILVMALLYSEGISFDPVYLPIEHSIYLILAFFLMIKAERFYFRFLDMKYSGTLQRKAVGVEHYKGMELPSTILLAFLVAVFFIPSTSSFIRLLFEIFSFDGVIPFSEGFTFNLALLFLTFLILSIAWLTFLIWYKQFVLLPELNKIAEPFVIEDVFLITSSGLLIKHITRELKPGVDDDILTAMLTAVKDFVKDSFRANEEGELDELQYGELRIVIEYGREFYIATVVRGQESRQLRPKIKGVIKQIQRKFGHVIEPWDGNLAGVKGIENLIKPLLKPE